ncbi:MULTISPECIES: bifunctional riboflavin kinase/FAD synthetase [Exiguobacterium]|uniref:bifunctional riboflavin kinase/FAD synthetase n=1 Tax=Exiguobacterium TaxID=33986 RepID=UPI00047E8DD1|nr:MULTISPECIES: bifunctional riboflavin kinase/FAD synthetase [Exiguobacterium]MCT4779656.1 bifunctional riboflavin kinase/FAD synthetase [Exiguobacterium soli]
MDIIHLTYPERPVEDPAVIALGFFDGVHLGHQRVLQVALEKGRQLNVPVAVMTFDPHPKQVLGQGTEQVRYITPLDRKLEKMAQLGIDRVYVIEFTITFSELSPQDFVDHYLIAAGACHIVAGFDYSYGRFGVGKMETLDFHSRGRFDHTTVSEHQADKEKVSSTRIRHLLASGAVSEAATLLGEPYQTKGIVIHGDARGRQIGFPTANIRPEFSYVIPKLGVYATFVHLEDGRKYPAMTNIGRRPTFYETGDVSIETHLLQFDEDLYGQELKLEWMAYLRDERAFDGIDSLKTQLAQDKINALQALTV